MDSSVLKVKRVDQEDEACQRLRVGWTGVRLTPSILGSTNQVSLQGTLWEDGLWTGGECDVDQID